MFYVPALLLAALAIFCVLFPLAQQKAAWLLAGEGALKHAASQRRLRLTALTALLFIPLFSFGLYLKLGHPQSADMPLQERRAASLDKADFTTLISRLEEHLRENKDDARGWTILARSYRSVGRFDDTVKAYRQVLKLQADSMPARLGLAEALVEGQGRVTPEAKEILQAAVRKDPKNPMARYFLARAKCEAGDKGKCVAELTALLADLPKDAPWYELVRGEIDKAAGTKRQER